MTLKVRRQLYSKVLSLHMGWFDRKENAPGQLSTVLAKDTATINGVGSESMAAQIEGVCTLIMAIALGFSFSWRMALVCLACIPLTMVGAVASIKFQKNLSEGSDDIVKEANVLAGDAILNYRTVASFGNAEQIIKEFDLLMDGPVQLYMRKAHFIGLSFGFANLSSFVTWAILYYTAARLISDRVIPLDEVSNTLLSIIVILFGAQSSAAAQSHAPDLGKAKVAADKIYGIIDAKVEIATSGEEVGVVKNSEVSQGFRGEIKFQDVWFRYPTRKTEWVLRGLNLTLHPNESVALVGESGCGKSTLVALILRFYDVDMGRILLDGRDIRDYPVALLRSMIGLVQ